MPLKSTFEFLELFVKKYNEKKHSHEYYLKNMKFAGKNISNYFLNDIYFDLCNFEDSIIKGSEIVSCEFFGGNLVEAKFSSSSINSSLFYGVSSFSSQFKNCRFQDVIFQGCNFEDAKFFQCEFNEVSFMPDKTNCQTDISDAIFANCVFHNTKFDSVLTSENTKIHKELLS